MSRRHASLLIVALLCVQLSSLWHMAEHDFAVHEHGGQSCAFSVFSNNLQHGALPTAEPHGLPEAEQGMVSLLEVLGAPRAVSTAFCARAPPGLI